MSKSYGNTITLAMTADETAAAIRKARTDTDRRITFDPTGRPGVSALLTTAALCAGTTPTDLAEQIGDAGAGRLKQITTEAVNTFLADHRRRRAALASDPGYVLSVLRAGNGSANAIGDATLDEVRTAMGTDY
jgi:tryptophanyl-tRNA synthetase